MYSNKTLRIDFISWAWTVFDTRVEKNQIRKNQYLSPLPTNYIDAIWLGDTKVLCFCCLQNEYIVMLMAWADHWVLFNKMQSQQKQRNTCVALRHIARSWNEMEKWSDHRAVNDHHKMRSITLRVPFKWLFIVELLHFPLVFYVCFGFAFFGRVLVFHFGSLTAFLLSVLIQCEHLIAWP